MTLFTGFKATHYRGIDGLSFPRLASANLVTGVNGIGKTAVIEAMWLFTRRYDISSLWSSNVQRSNRSIVDPIAKLTSGVLELEGVENESTHSLKVTFKKIDDVLNINSAPINMLSDNNFVGSPTVGHIRMELDGIAGREKPTGSFSTPWGMVLLHTPELSLKRPSSIILSTRFHHETSKDYLQIYSDMVRKNHEEDLKNSINFIFPKIADVEILIGEVGDPYMSVTTDDGERLPLNDLGDGVIRLYQLFLGFFSSHDGILFWDGVENDLHHSVLKDVWVHGRAWMRRWNVQLVATTQSAECIDAAIAAFEDTPNDLAIHKLFRNEKTGKVEVTTFTGETLEGVRDLNLETR